MEGDKKVELSKETVIEDQTTPPLGPVWIQFPAGKVLCVDSTSFTVGKIEHEQAGFLLTIMAVGRYGDRLRGTLTGFTPDQARSLAASLLFTADQCDGGIKGTN